MPLTASLNPSLEFLIVLANVCAYSPEGRVEDGNAVAWCREPEAARFGLLEHQQAGKAAAVACDRRSGA